MAAAQPLRAGGDGGEADHLADLPRKERFYVSEVAQRLAPILGITRKAAENRIYRAIDAEPPRLRAVRHLGTLMIPRAEVERVLKGEPTS